MAAPALRDLETVQGSKQGLPAPSEEGQEGHADRSPSKRGQARDDENAADFDSRMKKKLREQREVCLRGPCCELPSCISLACKLFLSLCRELAGREIELAKKMPKFEIPANILLLLIAIVTRSKLFHYRRRTT